MGEYISPIDRHRHFGDAGRAECAVCCLEAERDHERGLRQDLDRLANTLFEERDEARAERDRLRDELAVEHQNARALQGYFELAAENAIAAEAERDRLRAVVDALVDFRRAHDAYEADGLQPEEEVHLLEVAVTAWDRVTELLDRSADMGGQPDDIPERERLVHEDPELRASLEQGMAQAAAGEVESRGSFAQYGDWSVTEGDDPADMGGAE